MVRMTFLTGLYPSELKELIKGNSRGYLDNAANALQWALVDGFEENNCTLDIINLPFIGSFPFKYKRLIISGYPFCKTKMGLTFESPSFVNLSLFKMVSRYYVTRRSLVKLQNTQDVILIYSLSSPFLKAAVKYKKKYPKTKLYVIVADLPNFMSDSKNIGYRILKFIDKMLINRALKKTDGFVLLSAHMKSALPIYDKPSIVVEGVFNNKDDIPTKRVPNSNKVIMYSGTLAKRYGILNLITAFSNIKELNYRLIICGYGDASKTINDKAKNDNRIIYLGNINREEVLKLQKTADLLVNPRTAEGEFTKYSFPSKTMEYLASGTPTLLYRLPGIPEEYYKYSYQIKGNSTECLTKAIESVLEKPKEELDEMGKKAREFILNNKNAKKQAEKIITFIKGDI